MVDRNQNRSAATISNSGREVNRIISNAIGQLEDVMRGDQQGHIPYLTTARDSSTFDDTSAGSTHVSTAVSPSNDIITSPADSLRRGQLFGRSSSSHSRDNAPCGVEQPITSIPVIPTVPPSEETTTAGPGLDSVPQNANAQSVKKYHSEHLVKTAEAIGSPCGRKHLHIPQGPSAVTTDKIVFYNTDKHAKPSSSLGEHYPFASAEHHTLCAQTPVFTGTSIPSDSSHRRASHTRIDTLPTASNQTHVNISSFDPAPKTASLNGRQSNSIEANTSCAETRTSEWLTSERSSKTVNSSGTLEGSITQSTNHFEAGSPTSASGRLPLTGFDREQWNIARNDNSDTAMPRLITARESSEDSLHTAKGEFSLSTPPISTTVKHPSSFNLLNGGASVVKNPNTTQKADMMDVQSSQRTLSC
ncbi:unnamed protein product [Angiostrongylus costaricensis]|uniref:Uncharacterized protein n=1 Tax=Angiostrongylus costaricensis TaxID=334426 RepID=A0A0R3PYE5_ANGCS|nr:unnamed protein product [Angiostrongylus costaricensis]